MQYEEQKAKIAYEILNSSYYIVRKDEPIIVKPNKQLWGIELDQIKAILKQFEKEGKLEILQYATDDIRDDFGVLGSKPSVLDYKLIKVDLEYMKGIAKNSSSEHSNIGGEKFFITYSETDRRILLNGKMELSSPNFDSENDIVFRFLFNNPNQIFSKKELEENCKTKISKPFVKILENLGFQRGIKDAFFDVSKYSIKFHNPAKI